MRDLWHLLKHTKTANIWFVVVFILAIVSSLLAVVPVVLIGYSLDVIALSDSDLGLSNLIEFLIPSHDRTSRAYWGVGLYLAATVVSILFRNFYSYCATVVSDKTIANIRTRLYDHLLRLDYREFLGMPKGQIIHSIVNDTQRLESILSQPFYGLFSDVFDLIWISVLVIIVDPVILLLLCLVIPLIYIASAVTGRVQKRVFQRLNETESQITTRIEQTISGYETIKAFGGEGLETRRFRTLTRDSLRNKIASARSLMVFFPVEGVLRAIGTAVVIAYSISRALDGVLSIGIVAVVFQYSLRFYTPIRNVSSYYQTIQSGLVAAGRILVFLRTNTEGFGTDNQRFDVENEIGSVYAEDLTVRVNGSLLVQDAHIEIKPGDFILVRGPNGSGKSTLLKVILGLLSPDEGRLRIDDRPISFSQMGFLRKRIGYSSQNIYLSNESLLSNIVYPRSVDELDQSDATRVQHLVEQMDIGYLLERESLGDDGRNTSGGEKKRIAFCRALMREPDLLLLDEVFAGLDEKSQAVMIDYLKRVKGETTVVVVSHTSDPQLSSLVDKTVTLEEV